jgi:hypothetical protein
LGSQSSIWVSEVISEQDARGKRLIDEYVAKRAVRRITVHGKIYIGSTRESAENSMLYILSCVRNYIHRHPINPYIKPGIKAFSSLKPSRLIQSSKPE